MLVAPHTSYSSLQRPSPSLDAVLGAGRLGHTEQDEVDKALRLDVLDEEAAAAKEAEAQLEQALGAGTRPSHRRGGVSVHGLGIPGGGGCVAHVFKARAAGENGGLEG